MVVAQRIGGICDIVWMVFAIVLEDKGETSEGGIGVVAKRVSEGAGGGGKGVVIMVRERTIMPLLNPNPALKPIEKALT